MQDAFTRFKNSEKLFMPFLYQREETQNNENEHLPNDVNDDVTNTGDPTISDTVIIHLKKLSKG